MNAYGYRIYGQREHEAAPPPPELRRSPLAEPQGVMTGRQMPVCAEYEFISDELGEVATPVCFFFDLCIKKAVSLGKFVDPLCEQACCDDGKRGGTGRTHAENRRAIFAALQDYGPLTVNDLAQHADVHPSTALKQMKRLMQKGVVYVASYVMRHGARTPLYALVNVEQPA